MIRCGTARLLRPTGACRRDPFIFSVPSYRFRPRAPLNFCGARTLTHFAGPATICTIGIFQPARQDASCDSLAPAVVVASSAPIQKPTSVGKKSLWRRLRRGLRLFLRALKVAAALTPLAALYPLHLLKNHNAVDGDAQDVALASLDQDGEGGWYMRLCLRSVEWSGAAVIKLMQWASGRPDMFGSEFCRVFSRLQDATTPHSWAHTEEVMRRAYGDDWKQRINLTKLIGSGCIGQVYEGYVSSTNSGTKDQKVAIKVRHPCVMRDIDDDLDLMRIAVVAMDHLPSAARGDALKWLNAEGIVEEFAKMLKHQLDFRAEARNLVRFNNNFRKDDSIVFPTLVEGFDAYPDVLIESFCEGVPVMQYVRENCDDRVSMTRMCSAGIAAVCKMIFVDNFLHGDIHPGNVLVGHDKRLIFLDVGIVMEFSEADHDAIVNVLSSFIRADGRAAGRFLISDSDRRLATGASSAVDVDGYIEKMKALTDRASGKNYFMEHCGAYITYICDCAAMHHVMLNEAFVSAALAIKVQEGIALALDPAVECYRIANPIILRSELYRKLIKVGEKFGLDAETVKSLLMSKDTIVGMWETMSSSSDR